MALDDMGVVSTGISNSGINDIKNEFTNTLVGLGREKIMDLVDIENSLRSAWSGDDCEKYIENLRTMAMEICDYLNKYNQDISNKLDEVAQTWANFQSQNDVNVGGINMP